MLIMSQKTKQNNTKPSQKHLDWCLTQNWVRWSNQLDIWNDLSSLPYLKHIKCVPVWLWRLCVHVCIHTYFSFTLQWSEMSSWNLYNFNQNVKIKCKNFHYLRSPCPPILLLLLFLLSFGLFMRLNIILGPFPQFFQPETLFLTILHSWKKYFWLF